MKKQTVENRLHNMLELSRTDFENERLRNVVCFLQIMSAHLFKLQRCLTPVDHYLRYPLSLTKWHQVQVDFQDEILP